MRRDELRKLPPRGIVIALRLLDALTAGEGLPGRQMSCLGGVSGSLRSRIRQIDTGQFVCQSNGIGDHCARYRAAITVQDGRLDGDAVTFLSDSLNKFGLTAIVKTTQAVNAETPGLPPTVDLNLALNVSPKCHCRKSSVRKSSGYFDQLPAKSRCVAGMMRTGPASLSDFMVSL